MRVEYLKNKEKVTQLEFRLKYAKDYVYGEILDKNHEKTLVQNEFKIDIAEEDEIIRGIQNPINSKRLKDIVNPGERVVIVTSDITRPMPSYKVLPHVVEELRSGGLETKDISVVLALGSHRGHSDDEKEKIVGREIMEMGIEVIDSDPDDCADLGMCRNGTPVHVFRHVADADRVICMGNIEYHYFAGYSGGAKAIMPGASSLEAIRANHSNMVKKEAYTGNLDSNPVRQDIDQVGEFMKIDYIVNVVLDENKKIAKCVCGHYIDAHRSGCGFLDGIYRIRLEGEADIVIASPGGFPKDINLYQAQKGLDNAKLAVRKGGVIVLVASCKEGFGGGKFEEWMTTKTPDDMIKEIKENFVLGGHKAAAIASTLKKASVFMVSDLDDETVEMMGFKPFKSVNEAVEEAVGILGQNSKIVIMPAAGSTLPSI